MNDYDRKHKVVIGTEIWWVSYDGRQSDEPSAKFIRELVDSERSRQEEFGGWGNTYRVGTFPGGHGGTYHVWNEAKRPK